MTKISKYLSLTLLIAFFMFLFVGFSRAQEDDYYQREDGYGQNTSQSQEQATPSVTTRPTPTLVNLVQSQQTQSQEDTTRQLLINKAKNSWPWYITRASGITSAVILAVLLLSGMGFITGHTFRLLEPITAWATHRALGIALGISVLIHISTLYIDKYIPFSLTQIFVPFVSNYKRVALGNFNVGSLYVALGIFAFYILLTIILTSLLWIDTKPRAWKLIHLLTYAVGTLVFFHGLFVGTDLQNNFIRIIYVAIGIVIMSVAIIRTYRAKTV